MTRPDSAPGHSADVDPPLPTVLRWLLVLLAIASLGLGIAGIFLPVLPTVPFVLLAAWAAARSSPRLARWMEEHPHMGPHIRAWRRGGIVPRRAKWLATVMMACSATGLLLWIGPWWPVLATVGVMAAVDLWLWLRPEELPG
ncbi:MAG: YbaN family protein [Ramlibacter sp.]